MPKTAVASSPNKVGQPEAVCLRGPDEPLAMGRESRRRGYGMPLGIYQSTTKQCSVGAYEAGGGWMASAFCILACEPVRQVLRKLEPRGARVSRVPCRCTTGMCGSGERSPAINTPRVCN